MIRVSATLQQHLHYKAPSWVWIGLLITAVYILAYLLAKKDVGTDFWDFPDYLQLGIAGPIDAAFRWTDDNLSWFFKPTSDVISSLLSKFEDFLLWLPWVAVVAGTFLLGLKLSGWRIGAFCLAGLVSVGFLGLWDSAMITLSVMGFSVLIAVAFAVPLGIAAAFSNRIESVLRPVLDTMQVMPAFVYLMPALFLFGVSGTQAVFLTVVYAIPPTIRLTNLGIRQVPSTIIDTAHSHGSGALQTLFQVQLPLSKPAIMMGVNQTIMMAMAMVVITAIVGTGGLGRDVWTALRQIDSGKGLEAGLAIVLFTIILDRLSYAAARQDTVGSSIRTSSASYDKASLTTSMGANSMRFLKRHATTLIGAGGLGLLFASMNSIGGLKEFPSWNISFADPVNEAMKWMSIHLHFITSWIRDNLILDLVMSPTQTFFLWIPWQAFLIGATGIAYLAAGKKVAVFAAAGTLFIGAGGVWDLAMVTLSQVLTASVFTISIGFVVGMFCSQSRAFENLLRPVLDMMQTMPIFVYLIPVIMLWGVGPLVGVIATVVYALPPMIRMTSLGIRQAPSEVVETSISHGATRLQTLFRVQLPLAQPLIMMGINQTIMMVLAMVIIAGLVGAGGLGQQVYDNSIYLEIGDGFVAGGAIVIIAVILDRMTAGKGKMEHVAVAGR